MPTLDTRDPAEDLHEIAMEGSPLAGGGFLDILAELDEQNPEQDLIRELDEELTSP